MTTELTTQQVENTIAAMTSKGRDAMEAIGTGKVSFFDEGVVEHSGSWGEILAGDLGHRSSGVLNRLKALGLWETSDGDDSDSGLWWSLTALGAAVANHLAGKATAAAAVAKPGYAVVFSDGSPTESFKTKSQAIARGEHAKIDFKVLSPRGFEVHVGTAPEAKPVTVPAKDLAVGMTVVGTVKRDPVRKIEKLSIGRKHVTAWSGKSCVGYWDLKAKVQVVA